MNGTASGAAIPAPDVLGDGEWIVIEGHHDRQLAAETLLRYATDELGFDHDEVVSGSWSDFVESVQLIHATEYRDQNWVALHTEPGNGSRPVTVLGVDGSTIRRPHPEPPESAREDDRFDALAAAARLRMKLDDAGVLLPEGFDATLQLLAEHGYVAVVNPGGVQHGDVLVRKAWYGEVPYQRALRFADEGATSLATEPLYAVCRPAGSGE